MKLRTEIWRKTDEKRAALFFCHLAPVTNHSPQSLKGSIQVVYSCKSNAAVYVLHRWINYCCYVSWPALCSWSPPSPPLMSQSRVMRSVPLAAQAVKSLQASSLVTEGTAVGERLENTTTTASGIPAESKYFVSVISLAQLENPRKLQLFIAWNTGVSAKFLHMCAFF